MAYQLPEKLKSFTPYEPITGVFSVRSDANESFLDIPQVLRKQIVNTIETLDFNRYPDPYCKGLCENAAKVFGVPAEHLVAGNGSDELIGLLVSAFADAENGLCVVQPDFSMYRFYADFFGISVYTAQKDELALSLVPDDLIAFAKQSKAGVLILSNPCNPTSMQLGKEDILKIVNGLDCLVVIDEAYMDFSDQSVLQDCAKYDNLVVLKTCSKAFGMAGIRLGFAISGNLEIVQALYAVKSPYNVNSMTQAIGTLLFAHPDFLREQASKLAASCQTLCREIKRLQKCYDAIIDVYDSRTNFVFLRMKDAGFVFKQLLQRGIAVRCMQPFLRISAGSAQENGQITKALEEILQEATG